MTPKDASNLAVMFPYASLAGPLVGRTIDYFKATMTSYYIICFLAVSGSLSVLFEHPILGFCMLGLGYSIRVCAEFPLVNSLVEKT